MIEEGSAALNAGDVATARAAFESALAEVETGIGREGLGQALYLQRDYSGAIKQHERAYAAYRREGQTVAAARVARILARITGNVLGDWAVQNGWLARALRILAEVEEDAPEHGSVLIIRSYTEPDAAAREALFREAIAIGRRFADPNIEIESLASLAGLYLMTGRDNEGLGLLDESMAALCAGELTEIASVDNLFCGLFWACELVNDVVRADQWMRATAEVMASRNVVAAFCRAHYGGILTAAGCWQEAEVQLIDAARHFDRGMPERRAAAIIRLADLRVRQARLEEAGQLLKGLEQHPDAVRTLAAFHLARGDATLARDLLERATEGADEEVAAIGASTMLGPLLALLVDAGRWPRLPRAGLHSRSRTDRATPAPHRASTARDIPAGSRGPRARPCLRRQRPRRCTGLSERRAGRVCQVAAADGVGSNPAGDGVCIGRAVA
jgi:tetratricopeptide (TPR) repeat protein